MSLNPSSYYEIDAIAAAVERGGHRQIVGDLWDELGALQIEFLVSNGLAPHHTLLDIGCGSLRLGVRAISHLNVGCYWGTDINESLMSAGYEREVSPAGLGEKLPRTNLVQDADFTFKGIPHHIDFAVAQSVFTHLPLNHMRLCLANLSAHLAGPCEFFFTVFMLPEGESFEHLSTPRSLPLHCERYSLRCGQPSLANRVCRGLGASAQSEDGASDKNQGDKRTEKDFY